MLWIANPIVGADDGVAQPLRGVLDGRTLPLARGKEPGRIDFKADLRRPLVREVCGNQVDLVLHLAPGLGAVLLVDIADIVLVRELVALADGDLQVAWLQRSALVGGQSALLRRAREDAALREQLHSTQG